MHNIRLTAVGLVLVLASSGCAHDVHVRLKGQEEVGTGTITILLTQPARDLTVAINGTLVAERKHTRKVKVEGVEAGRVQIVVAAGSGPTRIEKQMEVWLDIDKEVVIPMPSPDQPTSSLFEMGLLSLVAAILARVIVLTIL